MLQSIKRMRKVVSPISSSLRKLSQNSQSLPDVSINSSSSSNSNDTNVISNVTTTSNTIINVNSDHEFSSLSSTTFSEFKIGVNLQRFGVNLTKLSLEGKLDPVVGRDKEVEGSSKYWLDERRIIPY